MAIVQETYTLNGRQYVRTYSDAGRYVVGGEPNSEYSEANDPAELGRTYTEGSIMPDEKQPAPSYPAWDIWNGRHITRSELCSVDGRLFSALQDHDAAWNKRPLTGALWTEYWEEVSQ